MVPRLVLAFSVSLTQLASGSPVITGKVVPLPGTVVLLASRITADASCVF